MGRIRRSGGGCLDIVATISGGVLYLDSSGNIANESVFTYNSSTDTLSVPNLILSNFTQGSVLFAGAAGIISQDNANFFWDNTNDRLGIGTTTPDAQIHAVKTFIIDDVISSSIGPDPGLTSNYLTNDFVEYYVYAFIDITPTQRVYSVNGFYLSYSFLNDSESANILWTAVSGASGYRIIRSINNAGFNDYIDTIQVQIEDDYGFSGVRDFTSGSTVTPYSLSLNTRENYQTTTFYSLYGDGDGYLNGSLGLGVIPSYKLHVLGSGAKSTFVIQGSNDGGFGTYSQVEIRDSSGNKAFFMGDDNNGAASAGVLNFFGNNSAAGSNRGEITFFNNNLSGDKRVSTWRVVQDGADTDSAVYLLTRKGGSFQYNIFTNSDLNTGFGGISSPSARVHMGAGTTSYPPLLFTSGSLNTSPVSGAVEFLSDKWYATITTGSARKEFTLNEGALTSGRVSFSTTNGRQTDSASFTFSGSTLTVTNIAATTFTGDVTLSTKNIITDTTTGTKIGTGTSQKLGFFNATPIVRPSAYTVTNPVTDRAYDTTSTTLTEVAQVLGTLIADLKSLGLIG